MDSSKRQVDVRTGSRWTVGSLIELIGFSRHTWHTVLFVWAIYILCGWASTMTMYLIDAAGVEDGAWAKKTSSDELMTPASKSLTLLLVGVAAMLGNLILGSLGDLQGRIFAIKVALACTTLATMGFFVARSKTVLMIIFTLSPFGRDGLSLIVQSLLAEWLPITWRGFFLVSIHLAWNLGRLALTVLWMLVPPNSNWDSFIMVAATLPLILLGFTVVFGARFESPRWLAVRGDAEGSISNLRLAAGTEKGLLPEGWDDPTKLQLDGGAGQGLDIEQQSLRGQLLAICDHRVLPIVLKLFVCLFALAFGGSGVFFWIAAFLEARGEVATVPLIMAVAPIAKMLTNGSLILGGPGRSLIDHFERVLLMKVGFLGFGAALLLLCYVTGTALIVFVFAISQCSEELVWAASGVYMTEQLPTSVRNFSIGIISIGGAAGGVFGASLGGLLMARWECLHMLVMSILAFAGFAVCWFMPADRSDQKLVDVLQRGTANASSAYGTVSNP